MSLMDDGTTSDSDCPDRSDGVVNSAEVPAAAHKYVTYHRRWYLLASLAVLALSNGMVCSCLYKSPRYKCSLDAYPEIFMETDVFHKLY